MRVLSVNKLFLSKTRFTVADGVAHPGAHAAEEAPAQHSDWKLALGFRALGGHSARSLAIQ